LLWLAGVVLVALLIMAPLQAVAVLAVFYLLQVTL
jgi:hypothetical protein